MILVIVTAQGFGSNPNAFDVIPCSSGRIAQLWQQKYIDAGWHEVIVGGYVNVITEAP
jgi:hypothetical protein